MNEIKSVWDAYIRTQFDITNAALLYQTGSVCEKDGIECVVCEIELPDDEKLYNKPVIVVILIRDDIETYMNNNKKTE